jgi:DNA-binding NtrC family response regulator
MRGRKEISIIVVDDEDSVRLSLSEFLEDQGYEVRSARDAEEALQLIRERMPDLMVVDLRLPGMDGTQLILESHTMNPEISFIIQTGCADFKIPDYLAKIGLYQSSVLYKPVGNIMEFVDLIESTISEKKILTHKS